MLELRLAGICTAEAANAFAPSFIEDFNRRFARPPLNPHDAHRPLREDESLDQVFTWQEARTVTRALTINYQRVRYILDKTPAAKDAMGKQVTVVETDDGHVTIVHRGQILTATAFEREGHVHQAAIVENKLLSGALEYVRALQDERDENKLDSKRLTKRDKRLLRARLVQLATP